MCLLLFRILILSYYYIGGKLSTLCTWRNVSMSNVSFIIKYINHQMFTFQMRAAVLLDNFCDQNRPIHFFHIRRIYNFWTTLIIKMIYNQRMCRTINPMYVLIKLKLFSLNKIASVWTSPSNQSQAFGWRWGEDYCSTCLINWHTHQNTLVKRCISTTSLFSGIHSSNKFCSP